MKEVIVSLPQAVLLSSTLGQICPPVDDAWLSFHRLWCFSFSHRRKACYSFFFVLRGMALFYHLLLDRLIVFSCVLVLFVQRIDPLF